ncbi:MAG: mechanosensitive ion channel family protein [Aggregatilineales bacterium]
MLETIAQRYILPIVLFYAIAIIIHLLANPIAGRIRPLKKLTLADRPGLQARFRTLQSLLSNAISIFAFIIATLLSLTLFFSADSLLWVMGLFSAAFGLGARPFISDYLTGLSFIFEDTFDVGDKIEIPVSPHPVLGVVEKVNLRATQIRGMDGEVMTMPNGDIRLVRNFSRGNHSPTSVTLKIPATKLSKTLDHLEAISAEAMTHLPNLIEPLKVISKSGELGEETELTVLAKARYGKGAELRTRLLAYLHQELDTLNVGDHLSHEEKSAIHIDTTSQ